MYIEEFEALQDAKIEQTKKLLNIATNIGTYVELKSEEAALKKGLRILAEHLSLLLKKIKAQQEMCGKDGNCISLLEDEVQELAGRNKVLGTSIIEHVKQAAAGFVKFQSLPVCQALIFIIGKEQALKQLFASDKLYSAAA